MVSVTLAISECCRKLNFRLKKLGIYPGSDVFEIHLETNGPKNICYIDLLIEMRLWGFIFTNTIHLSETHFIIQISKAFIRENDPLI